MWPTIEEFKAGSVVEITLKAAGQKEISLSVVYDTEVSLRNGEDFGMLRVTRWTDDGFAMTSTDSHEFLLTLKWGIGEAQFSQALECVRRDMSIKLADIWKELDGRWYTTYTEAVTRHGGGR